MKAFRPVVKKLSERHRTKSRLHAHAVFMYKLQKEARPVDAGEVKRPRVPTQFLLRRVGLEAARLSSLNRCRVVTLKEVEIALKQLRRRQNAAPMDGA